MNMFIPAILATTALAMVAEVGPGKAVEKLQVTPTGPRFLPRAARSLQAANRIVTRLGKRRLKWVIAGVEGVLLSCQLENHFVVIVVSPFLHSSYFGVGRQYLGSTYGVEQEVGNAYLTFERVITLDL